MQLFSPLTSLLAKLVSRLFPRQRRLQCAALCHREGEHGREVLLVTSSRGRWILPKGWQIDGLSDAQAAKQEAWEEAGVKKGHVSRTPMGSFLTHKELDDGTILPLEQRVFAVAVRRMTKKFPESGRRKRIWVSPKRAAEMVDEKGLKTLLAGF